jgi:hypothetical protein
VGGRPTKQRDADGAARGVWSAPTFGHKPVPERNPPAGRRAHRRQHAEAAHGSRASAASRTCPCGSDKRQWPSRGRQTPNSTILYLVIQPERDDAPRAAEGFCRITCLMLIGRTRGGRQVGRANRDSCATCGHATERQADRLDRGASTLDDATSALHSRELRLTTARQQRWA